MPRFVLLHHACPPGFEKPSHWDFMLEEADVLRTWELRELPAAWADALGETSLASEVTAHPLPDHRLEYLEYEGPLSGRRGSVSRCDTGTYDLLRADPDGVSVLLLGNILRGEVRLSREQDAWCLASIGHSQQA